MREHVAFGDEHHELIGSTEFPFEEVADRVDGGLTATALDTPTPRELAADVLREVLAWAWLKSNGKPHNFRVAFNKFVALSSVIRPEFVGELSYRQIGERLGTTKAAVSKNALKFTQRFGVQFPRQHNGKDNMRRAALLAHHKRKYESPS